MSWNIAHFPRRSPLLISYSTSKVTLTYMRKTHWDRGTYIYVSKLNIIGSDNVMSPSRRQDGI